MMATESFVTGSRAYGTPRPDSDIDLVVRVNPEDLGRLIAASDKHHRYDDNDSASVRFGSLNLICVTSDAAFDAWESGTKALSVIAPVSREEAIEHFAALGVRPRFDSSDDDGDEFEPTMDEWLDGDES